MVRIEEGVNMFLSSEIILSVVQIAEMQIKGYETFKKQGYDNDTCLKMVEIQMQYLASLYKCEGGTE